MGDRKVMHLVDKAWRHIPTKFQIDPTGNHGFMPLGLKVNVYGNATTKITVLKHSGTVENVQTFLLFTRPTSRDV